MVLWQAELRVSWQAQWVSLLLHGLLVMVVLFLPWSFSYMLVCLLLLVMLVWGCVCSQRRIRAQHGQLQLLAGRYICWRGVQWQLVKAPLLLQSGVVLVLCNPADGCRLRLWLMSDSMDEPLWRDLRCLLLNKLTESRCS